ncbi:MULTISPECIES: EAL domain-containing protein [Arthrobacter]|uniref:EAL domain-containing protein n=1 Tax=Arthrobacter terricola TaxID=2547396 RepID=A0A4R5KHM8_9MICC|nr:MULTISPECIES: EAL domain-containing protein [Arthrobacter]MBT8159210.1 EAL domain-containing protein [Arthrobacter sp. GN70]TDF94951.1 EAL domain-containing protein [Arthrobacter terricola]
MSTQKPSSLAVAEALGHATSETIRPSTNELLGLRSQVLEIIDEVLADSSETSEEVREQLRKHLEAHPGRPEIALLEHLASLKEQESGMVVPAADPDSAEPEPAPESDEPQDETSEPHGSPRLEAVLRDRMLVTAFQPVFDLRTQAVVGAEALTRFVSDGGDPADYWFAEAEDSGLRTDLEFAALESALSTAAELPQDLFVALKLSHVACIDPRLHVLFDNSPVAPSRVVLELTGRFLHDQSASLDAALKPLRAAGVRLSIENTGSYFAAVSHISRLKPEMIKLDRNLASGLDRDLLRQELVEAEVAFAAEIGAVLSAQRIETEDELATVTGLGIALGQGFHLGRPSVQPREWAAWGAHTEHTVHLTAPARSRRTASA